MADVVDKATRSRMMAGIRGKDTRPEMTIRRGLHRSGFRFRLHDRGLAGKPDLVLPKWRAVIFVHGCFWHRHNGCRNASTPATRPEFWAAKFSSNVHRDRRAMDALQRAGWRVATVWECAIRRDPGTTVARVSQWIGDGSESAEID